MEKRLRKNEQITRVAQVMLVEDDAKPEVISFEAAMERAVERSLDLVEIGPNQVPPVCKIMDFGAHLYQEAKKLSQSQKKGREQEVKEMRFRPATDDGDFNTKSKQLKGFLEKGHKVKVTIRFKGREIAHAQMGFEMIQRVSQMVEEAGQLESPAKMEGRQLVTMFAPAKGKKKSESSAAQAA